MEELIKTFHIEINLLIAQFVNFAIVLFVLWKFAYKPVLSHLNERTKKIERGVRDAEEAKKKLEETSEKEKVILSEAKIEAQEIIKRAEAVAVKDAELIIISAKEQSEKISEDAKKSIEREKGRIITEAKNEIAELVITASEKLIREKIDRNKDKEIIEKSIK